MSYQPTERNYKDVQFGSVREQVEPVYTSLVDELSACYYDHWQLGESRPFVTKDGSSFDVVLTDGEFNPDATKELFDKLHGLIYHRMELALQVEYKKLEGKEAEKYQRYNDYKDQDDPTVLTKEDLANRFIDQLTQEGIEIDI
jgi:hypothetical protein